MTISYHLKNGQSRKIFCGSMIHMSQGIMDERDMTYEYA